MKKKGKISLTGYKSDSPDKNNPFNIIPSSDITMMGVEHPVFGIDDLGNAQLMYPGYNYKFPGQYVTEYPMNDNYDFKRGGYISKSKNSRTYKNIQSSLNDLFTRNELVFGPSGRRRYLPYEEYIKIMKNKKEKGGIAFPQQPTAAEFFNAGFVPNMPFAFYAYGGSMFPDGGQWPKGLSKSLTHMLEPGSQELTPEQIMQLGYAQISGNEYSDPQGNTYFYKPMHMGTSSAGYSAGKSSGKQYSVVLKKGQKPSNALLQAYGASNLDIYNKEYGGVPYHNGLPMAQHGFDPTTLSGWGAGLLNVLEAPQRAMMYVGTGAFGDEARYEMPSETLKRNYPQSSPYLQGALDIFADPLLVTGLLKSGARLATKGIIESATEHAIKGSLKNATKYEATRSILANAGKPVTAKNLAIASKALEAAKAAEESGKNLYKIQKATAKAAGSEKMIQDLQQAGKISKEAAEAAMKVAKKAGKYVGENVKKAAEAIDSPYMAPALRPATRTVSGTIMGKGYQQEAERAKEELTKAKALLAQQKKSKFTPAGTDPYGSGLFTNPAYPGKTFMYANGNYIPYVAPDTTGYGAAAALFNKEYGGDIDEPCFECEEMYAKGGWIQAANKRMKAKGTKGSFTKYCGGKVTNECIQRGLNSSNPTTRKRAAFAKAMRSIRKEDGGETAPQNFGTDSILENNKLTFMDYLKNNYESSLYDELENEYMMADGGAIDFNPMALSNAQMFDDAYNEMVDERDQNRRSFFDASMNMQQASRMMNQPQFAGNQQDINIDPNMESYMNDYYKAMGEDQIPMAQYGLSFFPYNMAPYYKSKWKYKSASGDRMKGKSHYDPRFSSLSGFNYGAMSPDQMAALAQAYRNAGIDLKIETNPGLLGRVFKNIGPRKVTITAKSMGKPGSSQSLYEASKSPSKANLDRYYEDLNKAMYEEELRRNTEGLPARPDYQEPTSTSLLNIGSTPIDKQMFFKKKLEEDLNQFQQGGQDEFKMVQKRSPGFMSNPATAPWMLAGVDMLTNMFSADERRAAEEEAKKRKTFDYWTTANQSSQGDYLVDPYAGQSFRPNATGEKITPWGAGNFSQNIGNAYSAQFGGEMVDGEYELTDEQIEYIKARGGSVEYLD